MCGQIGIEHNGKVIPFSVNTTMSFVTEKGKEDFTWVNWAQAEKFKETWASKTVSLHKLPISYFVEKGKKFTVKDRCVVFARNERNQLRLLTKASGDLRKVLKHSRRPLFIRPDQELPSLYL